VLGFLIRASGISLLVLAIGCAAFTMLARSTIGDTRNTRALFDRVARIGMYASLALIPVAFARLYMQLDAMRFPGESLTTSFNPLLTTTVWGKAWAAQIAFAGVSAGAFGASLHARSTVAITSISLTIVALTFSLSGHAASAERFRSAVVSADALHVVTAGTWIGTLAVIVITWRALRELHAVAAIINAFSPLALASAAMLTVSGVAGALVHVTPLSSVFTSSYGRVLLVKLFLVAIVIATGWFNWKRHTARISADEGTALQSGAIRELSAAVAVILATAALIGTSPD
jgi:putative copper export protein